MTLHPKLLAPAFTCAFMCAALALPLGAAAQQPSVTDADIARTRKQINDEMRKVTPESVEAARKKYIVPQQQGVNDQAINAFRPQLPKLDALPALQSKPNVDIGALAGQVLSQGAIAPLPSLGDRPKLMVMVSMAMPNESLKALVQQARQAGATLVLRGMVNNSMKDTYATLKRFLLKGETVPLNIDPEAFDRFAVNRVPTFVVTKSSAYRNSCGSQQCAPESLFVKVAGDVSIEYALEKIESNSPRFRAEAREFLKNIRG